jgi:hypothetical protein
LLTVDTYVTVDKPVVRESEREKEADDLDRLPPAWEELCWAKAATARKRRMKKEAIRKGLRGTDARDYLEEEEEHG